MIGYENCLDNIEFIDRYYAFLDCVNNLYIYRITLNKERYIALLKKYGTIKKFEFKCYANPKKIENYLNDQHNNYLKEKRIVSVEYQKRELLQRIYLLSSFNIDNLRKFFEEKTKLKWENIVNDFYSKEVLEILAWKLFFYSMIAYKEDIYINAIKDLMLSYEYDEIAALPSSEFKNYANNLDWYYKLGFKEGTNFDYYLSTYLKEAEERSEHFDFLNVDYYFKKELIPRHLK